MTWKSLHTRFSSQCSVCRKEVPQGTEAYWDTESRELQCTDCHAALSHYREASGAGAGARYEYERRALREASEKERKWGKVLSFLTLPWQTTSFETRAWLQGSKGEAKLGALLDAWSARHDGTVLHDCRASLRPGARSNIDHIAIAPTGVYVIDTKTFAGTVAVHRGGIPFLRESPTLLVRGVDRTNLVDRMDWQVETVQRAMDDLTVPINPILCIMPRYAASWKGTFRIRRVLITDAQGLIRLLRRRGTLHSDARETIARRLQSALPPSSGSR